jgi:hypothetical protein
MMESHGTSSTAVDCSELLEHFVRGKIFFIQLFICMICFSSFSLHFVWPLELLGHSASTGILPGVRYHSNMRRLPCPRRGSSILLHVH